MEVGKFVITAVSQTDFYSNLNASDQHIYDTVAVFVEVSVKFK